MKRWMLVLTLAMVLVGCSKKTNLPDPTVTTTPVPAVEAKTPVATDSGPQHQAPGAGELLIDRMKVLSDVPARINEIAPKQASQGLNWTAERISVLAPRFVLVWYTEGHTAHLTLFRVDEIDGQLHYEPVVDGEPNPNTPVDWDWRNKARG